MTSRPHSVKMSNAGHVGGAGSATSIHPSLHVDGRSAGCVSRLNDLANLEGPFTPISTAPAEHAALGWPHAQHAYRAALHHRVVVCSWNV